MSNKRQMTDSERERYEELKIKNAENMEHLNSCFKAGKESFDKRLSQDGFLDALGSFVSAFFKTFSK